MQRDVLPNAGLHIGVVGHPGLRRFIGRMACDSDGTDHAASGLIQNGATNRQRAIGCHGLHARDMRLPRSLPAGRGLGIRAIIGNGDGVGAGGSHRIAGLGQALIG